MDTAEREKLTARLFFRAAFPVMKVVLQDDPVMKKKFRSLRAKVQISAENNGEKRGVCLRFEKGSLEVEQELCDGADITLHFKSLEKMNTMFRGGTALPSIKGLTKPGLLLKILALLMSLKLMMPDNRPKDLLKKQLKVKMSLYMITTAVSQYNKAGVEDIRKWTETQPDRIYQFSVEPVEETGIAAYIRIKGGKSKAGRGIYTRKRPFVHFRFSGVEGALKVLLKEVEFVEGVEKGFVRIDGSPEYAADLNNFMAVIQGMLT